MARVALLSHGGELLRPAESTLTAADLQPIPGTRTRYDLPGGLSLVSPRTFNPFAPTIVEAHSTLGTVAAVPWMAPGSGRSVQVPAGFTDLVLIRSEPGVIAAEAVVILPADATAEEADRLVDHAVASTNRLWQHVHSAMNLLQI